MIGAAYQLLKRSHQALDQWNSLGDEDQAQVKAEAGRLADRARDLGTALRSRVARALAERAAANWEQSRAEALNPSMEFQLARKVVEALRERANGSASVADLAAAVDAVDAADDELLLALHLAGADGYLEESQDGTWSLTEFADWELNESDRAQGLERLICECVRRVGLADRDQLAAAIGVSRPTDPEFLAGLERALASGAIQWLAWSTYGLPPDELVEFRAHAPDVDDTEGSSAQPDVKAAAVELGGALQALTRGLKSATQPPSSEIPGAAATDPYEALARLAQLRDAGVLTPQEFEAKKTELLSRV